ncbi:MAG: tyrosine-protein phosphatase [Erysipelotrichaceae bacterium]|nr:tyrosine-protein phosphatase [Erysipelotrichaceae bacterium]
MKKNRILLAGLLAALTLTACASEKQEESGEKQTEELSVEGLDILHEEEFGGVYITMSIDDFNALGFEYGDSVDVEFSNGYKLEDIPYYNGYYVDAGEPLLIAYPGYDYIKATINYGDDLWERAGLNKVFADGPADLWKRADLRSNYTVGASASEKDGESDTASIRLNERGKYLDVQQARDIHYSDVREKFPSDEAFANFRNFHPGDIIEGVLYRSASPCDNQHLRAPYVDDLIEQAGVNFILNLSDNDSKIAGYIAKDDFDSPYFLSLYEKGNVDPIALNMNYLSEEFAQKIAQGFIAMSEHEGPYLIHCTEGKDRTGFVCILIEALANASYQEIVDDYMLTYDNYYEINPAKDPAKYQTIKEKNVDAMLKFLMHDPDADLETADLAANARDYLLWAGMSEEQIDTFLEHITTLRVFN